VPSEFDPSKTSTVAFASELPEIDGVVSLVRAPVVGDVIDGAAGATVSIVSEIAVEAELSLPAPSLAFAVIE
jgi:hypothetical protein